MPFQKNVTINDDTIASGRAILRLGDETFQLPTRVGEDFMRFAIGDMQAAGATLDLGKASPETLANMACNILERIRISSEGIGEFFDNNHEKYKCEMKSIANRIKPRSGVSAYTV